MKTIIRNFLSVLRRFKMATLLNILGLSVAFSAFTVIMMQLDFDLNFDTCHKQADCIYRVELICDNEVGTQAIVSRPLAETFIQFSPHIVAGAVTNPLYTETLFTIEQGATRENYMEPTMAVYPSFADVFEFEMQEGSKAALAEPRQLLIPESMARKWFGNTSAVGKKVEANDSKTIISNYFATEKGNYTVGGVYKDFPANSILQNGIYMKMDDKKDMDSWGSANYNLFIRVDSPASATHLSEEFSDYFKKNGLNKKMDWLGDFDFRLSRLPDIHFATDVTFDLTPKTSRQTVRILFAIALIILFIAGINFTNFSTALTPMRIKSINTQKVLGSPTRTLRFSLLAEAICISMLAYLISLGIVHLLSQTFVASLVTANLSLAAHPLLAAATALIAIVTGILAGLYPAYYITSFSPALVLKGSFGLSPKGRKLRNILISVQFIASFALIIGAMFMYLQNTFMQRSPLGYEKDEIIMTDITPQIDKSKAVFTDKLKAFAGIEGVTFAEFLLSSQDQYMTWGRQLNDRDIQFQCLPVDATFLKTMGINITEGRDFRPEDKLTAHGVFLFNEKARKTYDIHVGDKIGGVEVVGFVPDVKITSFRIAIAPMAFLLWGKEKQGDGSTFAYIKVKAGTDLRAALQHVKKSLNEIHPDYPFNVRFFDDILNNLYEKETKLSTLISLFSLIAVFISIVGVFGLVVFDSQYRKKEIGVRKVLGSTTTAILIMFNKTYIKILVICFVVAMPVTYYMIYKWLENFAYKTPMYLWVFAVAFLAVFLLTVLTVTFQNWRTANENPVNSIKNE